MDENKMLTHFRVNHSETQCGRCDQMFNNFAELDEHKLQCYFKCPQCKSLFISNKNLKKHLRFVHHGTETDTNAEKRRNQEKTRECPHCFAMFKRSDSLRDHIVRMHTKDWPLRCELCEKGFLRRHEMESHLINKHYKKKD